MKEEKNPIQKYILMTYRSNISKAISTTYYNSDSGWGCMLRVAQMSIANYLYLYRNIPFQTIITLFWDSSDMPFSLQQLTYSASIQYPKKKPFQWFNPCEAGFIAKDLLQKQFNDLSISILLDNSIILSKISLEKPNIMVMIMIRVGLEEPEEIYLKALEDLTTSRYYFAALGGTPKHANLFLKTKQGKVGFLDPHKTYKSAENLEDLINKKQEYVGNLRWIKLSEIDSSMALIYHFKREEVQIFWQEMLSIKQKNKENFFLYMDKQMPVYNEDDIIQIGDDQFIY